MIFDSIRNLTIAHKIKKFPNLYSEIMKLDASMKPQDAYVIMNRVDPKETIVKVVKDAEEFKKLLTVNVIESLYLGTDIERNYKFGTEPLPIRQADAFIYVIKGEKVRSGEILTAIDGKRETRKPAFDQKTFNLVVRENICEGSLFAKRKYEIIAYIPS